MKHLWIMLWISLSLFSCSQPPSAFQIALQLAGDNRPELEKVLKCYSQNPADSLKYKAACFLIENMPYYHYYEGELLNNYLPYYKALIENPEKDPLEILKGFVSQFGAFSKNQLQVKSDIQEIDSAYLCNNIEWAFKVWMQQPWGKNVSFSDFCEYILPYRIGDEQPVQWREEFYEKYNPLLVSLRDSCNSDDPLTAVYMLMDTLSREKMRFTTIGPPMPNIGPFATEWKVGSCRELGDFVTYVCRALGIPCGIDYMPLRGGKSSPD